MKREFSCGPGRRDGDAPVVARTVVIAVLTGFCILELLEIGAQIRSPVDRGFCVLFTAGVMALQIGLFGRLETPPRLPVAVWALAAEAMLTYLPILRFHTVYAGMPGFLAGSLMLALPLSIGAAGFAVVVTSVALLQCDSTTTAYDIAHTTVSTAAIGGVVFGLTRLAGLVVVVANGRAVATAAAVAAERTRFSQDLHDLFGYRLTAIMLKAELSQRLVHGDPPGAHAELGEIIDITQQTVIDVRAVARGRHGLSLEVEAAGLASTLVAADIEADIDIDIDIATLPDHVSSVLAIVLREAVTNMLRHSTARHCLLRIGADDDGVELSLSNDGLATDRGDWPGDGSGLVNLEGRLATIGGQLTWGMKAAGRFKIDAFVPLPIALPLESNVA
ncbi:sensor histidine kinase [Nocardia alba]|uniref:Two-component system sensor histidine kinase DesK n=1 Tax=Nocardia alba TaxID=225051 RepID=A0A4R1FB27_9NOCA|nr:histidine kinase [Nocardia alba]TCJ89899.1 two-component system sensor histidine kinase DesK [Nocardia alba]